MMRSRFHIALAITLAGVAAGGIAAKLYSRDPSDRMPMNQLAIAVVVGGLAGAMVAMCLDRAYKARPRSRHTITLLAACALSAGFGGLYGWHVGVETASDPIELAITADQKMRIVRAGTAIGSVVGFGVGLVLGAFYLAMQWMLAFRQTPNNEGE